MKSPFYKHLQVVKMLFAFFLVTIGTSVWAARVDTVNTFSASMNKTIKAVVIVPDSYNQQQQYPTVYLLHGYSGNYSDYVKKIPAIKDMVDQHQMIVVCADGNFSSWYFDSPLDKKWKYETYIAKELVDWTDKNYKTRADKKYRALTGLSMGGHGALSIAIKHQDVFGAAGSMSGGLDLRPFPERWDIAKRLGGYNEFPERWEKSSVMELTPLLSTHQLALIIDCGKDDFFYKVNQAFHEKLLYHNIAHDFIIRPGGHTWTYWSNAIGYQLQYFNHFFNKKGSK